MKFLSIFLAVFLLCNNSFSQILFTYGNSQTTKAEFLRAYNKNKVVNTDKEKSLREYVELYTNFKLKVKAAQEQGLDTLEQIKYDVKNFRDQIIDNYLNDNNSLQTIINEAAERANADIHVLYFFVPINAGASASDSLKILNAANNLSKELKNSTDYITIATKLSIPESKIKFLDIGYLTVFSADYIFENIIYNTKIGDVSLPYRTSKGWHIFKPISTRPAVGKWNIAQLLFVFPPDADANTKISIKHRADSIYNLIKNGLPFADAAKLYSDDRATYQSGGVVQEFGAGKFKADFEENVFTLKNDEDITEPFETVYGIHIVKRLSQKPIPTDTKDYNYQAELKQKIQQDSRINNERALFVKEMELRTGFKKSTLVSNKELFIAADSINSNTTIFQINKVPGCKKTIATFKDGSKITGKDFLVFVQKFKSNTEAPKTDNTLLLDNFNKQSILDYYKNNLENYNPEFKYQMQEFKEGNMLFEIMERKVWSKAGSDSIALNKYYEANKKNYQWGASADVLVLNCPSETEAAKALQDLQNGINLKAIVEKSENKIQADSGRYELSQIANYKANNPGQTNSYSAIDKNTDGTASFVKYLKFYDTNMQRSFSDARGLIINDYQNVLEKEWLQTLRKKFVVKQNEVVFQEMLK